MAMTLQVQRASKTHATQQDNMHATMRQQLSILLLTCLAIQLSHAWLLKLPKLEDLLEGKNAKDNDELKKLDFLNLFKDKDEKKESELEKLKQWFEDKKLKELSFFETKKDKLEEKAEDKLKKKTKKHKSKGRTTTECYEMEATTESEYASQERYHSEEQPEEEHEVEEEVVVTKKSKKEQDQEQTCNCKKGNNYGAYDVHEEDYEDGYRYFT